MEDFNCGNGCCCIHVKKYTKNENTIWDTNRRSKAGVLLYDEELNKVLLVQSRGNLWGIPKGTLETDETFAVAALREVFEETGVRLESGMLHTYVKINNNCVYYFAKYKECDVCVQDHLVGNDANSIGWVNIDCLRALITDSVIKLNKHTEVVLEQFLNFN
jgi:8-oxo-dGTP pyrophosphatase MutT (NUDIX family)